MSLVSHLVEIIEHEGKINEDCQTCCLALATAESEAALDYPGAPNITLTHTEPEEPA